MDDAISMELNCQSWGLKLKRWSFRSSSIPNTFLSFKLIIVIQKVDFFKNMIGKNTFIIPTFVCYFRKLRQAPLTNHSHQAYSQIPVLIVCW